jgi:hypothetical protein
MYSYVAVVLYSIYLGGVDLVIPVKTSFVSTIIIVTGLAFGDVRRDWRDRRVNMPQLAVSIYRLIGEITLSLGLIVLAYFVILQPFSNVDLRGLSYEVKAVASVGIVSLVGFSIMVILDVLALRRKGSIPDVSISPPVEEERART